MSGVKSEKYISTGSEWNFELIDEYDQVIAGIAKEFGLDTYPNQIEIITSEQMLDAYSSVGMPVGYNHWSFGKQFIRNQKSYQAGHMGLAYEIVINSNPCIAYLMEENTMMMQALVIAHASYGHNSFFKGNYMFEQWTQADAIIDYLIFAKNYIATCEEKYGEDEVEKLLDACHALMNYGVDRYKRPTPISAEEEKKRQAEKSDYLQSQVNDLWRTIPTQKQEENSECALKNNLVDEPQENILYFFEKSAPFLEPWQREVVRIVRKIAQYFYPQRQTQVMNEGWATFWHYTIINTLYDRGYVNEGFMLEFMQSHTAVVAQPSFDSKHYSGINPYALGFSMMMDIKRICQNPTEEDRQWFPDFAGCGDPELADSHDFVSDKATLEVLDFAMRNFKDESFILQYLSPKVMRDLKLFAIEDDDQTTHYEVTGIHNGNGYQRVRETLSLQYNLSQRDPDIQIVHADAKSRHLYLLHKAQDRIPLGDDTEKVLKHLRVLWGADVHLYSQIEEGNLDQFHEPPLGDNRKMERHRHHKIISHYLP